jgi:hypothetical protein
LKWEDLFPPTRLVLEQATAHADDSDCDTFLSDTWNMYHHHIDDGDWTHESYTLLSRLGIGTLGEFWSSMSSVAEIATRSMFFFMRGDVFPAWDDAANLEGSTLSWKLTDEHFAARLFVTLAARLVADALLPDGSDASAVLGVSTSPKFKSYVVKLWLSSDADSATVSALSALIKGHTCRVAQNRDIIVRASATVAGAAL